MNVADPAALAERLDALLPQTQCTRCGYAGCRPYAQAIVRGEAINRCPPGGTGLIATLAALLDRPILPLDPDCGSAELAAVAFIDAPACIGCARCLPACPVDAILGAPHLLHTVLERDCNGCELCLAACPVDCIVMRARLPVQQAPTASDNREHFERHREREQRDARERERLLAERKRAAPPAAR
ncbi:MAG TPA: RnfABCDGE type electron transport complex subunit B [Steroidobacteraceae bacterium]